MSSVLQHGSVTVVASTIKQVARCGFDSRLFYRHVMTLGSDTPQLGR